MKWNKLEWTDQPPSGIWKSVSFMEGVQLFIATHKHPSRAPGYLFLALDILYRHGDARPTSWTTHDGIDQLTAMCIIAEVTGLEWEADDEMERATVGEVP